MVTELTTHPPPACLLQHQQIPPRQEKFLSGNYLELGLISFSEVILSLENNNVTINHIFIEKNECN